jgi:ferritin-like metal-binding protein YciE
MQDVYYAERQGLKALPKKAKATQSDELKMRSCATARKPRGQVERLQKALEALGKRARGQTARQSTGS